MSLTQEEIDALNEKEAILNRQSRASLLILRWIRAGDNIRRNPWRHDKYITNDNLNMESMLGGGGFGQVYKVRNMDTDRLYALKIQHDPGDYVDSPPELEEGQVMGDLSPSIARSSQASIQSERQIKLHHLRAKRHQETKFYLQYVKGGHRNICNLEAYFSIHGLEYERPSAGIYSSDASSHIHILELCNLGNLNNFMRSFFDHDEDLPEALIWRIFVHLMDGLTFLHGSHPDYVGKPNYHGPTQVLVVDLKPYNIFVHLPDGYRERHLYPIFKLGDFGISIRLPTGGFRRTLSGNGFCEPPRPETYFLSEKYEVWSVCCLIYAACRRFQLPKKAGRDAPIELNPAGPHISPRLEEAHLRGLQQNPADRPTALELWTDIRGMLDETRSDYVPLPDYINDNAVEGFDQEELWDMKTNDEEINPEWNDEDIDREREYYRQLEERTRQKKAALEKKLGEEEREKQEELGGTAPSAGEIPRNLHERKRRPGQRPRRMTIRRKYRAYTHDENG